MPTRNRETCLRRALITCAITTLVFVISLLIFAVLHSSWQPILRQDSDPDLKNDSCTSKVLVARDQSVVWNTSTEFNQAWSNAEQQARTPAHRYMEKRHSVAIYMYTQAMRPPGRMVLMEGSEPQLDPKTQSLFSDLSEAIQILKHSQVLCKTTTYTTDISWNLTTSGKLLRFSTFVLGSSGCRLQGNACFEVHTCFGTNVTYYSALKQNNQVLIPPYEVFKVTDVASDPLGGRVTHKLESNLDCVYDRESDSLHTIKASSTDLSWVIFGIMCIVIVFLFLPFVIYKVLKK